MNKEEILNKYIDLIDKGYCSDCNELNCIDNFPHAKITQAIRELQQENEKLHHYKALYQSLKKQKEELRDYLKARIEVCDNRLSSPFCNIENATKERLILSQYLEKMEELEGVSNE